MRAFALGGKCGKPGRAGCTGVPSRAREEAGLCQLLSHIEKLNALRAEIDKGVRSLDEGKGSTQNTEEFLRRKCSGQDGA